MKKNLISLTVASALLLPVVAQSADDVTVYGRVHMSYGQVTEEAGGVTAVDNWQVRSHDSRLGVKGSRDFGNGLSGIYKIEFGVNPDSDLVSAGDGTAGIVRRNQYVGLKGGFGEFIIGRHDTPLKMAQGKFDQFGDTDGDLKHAGAQDGEHRFDNIVALKGKSGDFGYAIAVAPGEDNGTGGTADTGPADTVSFSVSYNAGPLYIALAQDSYENGENLASDSLTRMVVTYKMAEMQLGLLYQTGVEKPAAAT
ncbi:MAG: porin, partial [Gammaproteobacteria bacterium]|nr:porin [Gammaproteobacteria bacterium]